MSTHSAAVGLLVVGGGPAAHHAAGAYAGQGGPGPVLLVSDDDTPPYLRPPLSKDFLRGDAEPGDLPLGDVDGVEVRTATTVTALDTAARTARLDDGSTVGYRQCVLAPGSAPVRPPFPGADDAVYLRRLADARELRGRLRSVRSVAVVGSGFIGCEAAASLARRGLDVTVCSTERVPQAARLGGTVGERIADWLRAERVRLRGGAEVTGVEATRGEYLVHVKDGDPSAADLVLVAAGIAPRTGLAEAAGLPLEQDRVVVDERMRSPVDGVLAAGDAALARNAAAGRHLAVEHWGDAETMGRIAGTTAAGGDAVWDVPPGFWTEIGDRTLKYSAWGDGFDGVAVSTHSGGGFTAWYRQGDTIVGVATHLADDDYEQGGELVRRGAHAAAVPGTPERASPADVPG